MIIKKFAFNSVFIILALIIQLLIPPDFIFTGIRPDFLLMITVVVGLIWGIQDGVAVGFITGILQSLFLGGISGTYILVKIIIGGLAGFIEKLFFKGKYILPPFIVIFLTFVHGTFIFLLSERLLFEINYISFLTSIVLPESILNGLISFFVYFAYYKIFYPRGNYYE